jgi:hypothetical protein
MADNNTSTPSNPFQGATFNTNAINALGSKANQALPNLNGLAGVLPYKKPDTWTPLGSWDATNAGINQTAGGISSVKYVGAIEKLSGGRSGGQHPRQQRTGQQHSQAQDGRGAGQTGSGSTTTAFSG